MAHRAEGGQVERTADSPPAARDVAGALERAAVAVGGSDADQGGEALGHGGRRGRGARLQGDGIIPMEPIMVAAKAAGVKHCHVEQDQSPDPIASIRQSMEYLKRL